MSLNIFFEKLSNFFQREKDFFVILAFKRINLILFFLIDLNILGQISDSIKIATVGFQKFKNFSEKKK